MKTRASQSRERSRRVRHKKSNGAGTPATDPESILSLFSFSAQFPYREALAHWPDPWRERWGRRANALEETGLRWRDAETRAFVEILHERRAESGAGSLLLVTSLVE